MSTKRAIVPFTQHESLFTQGGFKSGRSTAKTLAASGSLESNEIYLKSEHGFGTLSFVSKVVSGLTNITVSIKYRIPGTDVYTDKITIDTISHSSSSGKGYAWRLDAKLNINWVPNQPFKIVFDETNGFTNSTVEGVAGV